MREWADYLGFRVTQDPSDVGQVIYSFDLQHDVRPDGPVVRKACASKGHSVEMTLDSIHISHTDASEDLEDTQLQSYRCPEYETVTHFRMG